MPESTPSRPPASTQTTPSRWVRRAQRYRPHLLTAELDDQRPSGKVADTVLSAPRPMDPARRRASRARRRKRGRS